METKTTKTSKLHRLDDRSIFEAKNGEKKHKKKKHNLLMNRVGFNSEKGRSAVGRENPGLDPKANSTAEGPLSLLRPPLSFFSPTFFLFFPLFSPSPLPLFSPENVESFPVKKWKSIVSGLNSILTFLYLRFYVLSGREKNFKF